MTDSVTIGGVSYSYDQQTLSLQRAVGNSTETTPCTFTITDETGAYTFSEGQTIVVSNTVNGTSFSGYIDNVSKKWLNPGGACEHTIECKGMSWLAQKRVLTTDYSGMNPECMVKHIIDDVLAAEGVTYDSTSIPDSVNYAWADGNGNQWKVYADGNGSQKTVTSDDVIEIDYRNKTIANLFDNLADRRIKTWKLDATKKFYFRLRTAEAAPWTLTTTDIDFTAQPTLKSSGERYRNSQHLLNSNGIQDLTESFDGDGDKRTFTLVFPVHETPSINVNGIITTSIGINGVDSNKQWYWSKGSNIISQDYSAGAIPIGSTIEITYVGEYDQDVSVSDAAQIAARKTLDQTSGIVESVDSVDNVMTETNATKYANDLLNTMMSSTLVFEFRTIRTGLKEGQNLTVNCPTFDSRLSNVQMFIASISNVPIGPDINGEILGYDVKAVTGPLQRAWPTIFGGTT